MKHVIETMQQLQELETAPQPAAPEAVAKLRKKLPTPVLAHYDRFRARGRKPLAIMSGDGVCRGCNMRASRGVLMDLQRGDEIQVCEHCGRYLLGDPLAFGSSRRTAAVEAR